jgi:hypothetical protein
VYCMEVSFIEIYNETIRDLIRPNTNPNVEYKHEIKREASGQTVVTDVTMRAVDPNNEAEMVNEYTLLLFPCSN